MTGPKRRDDQSDDDKPLDADLDGVDAEVVEDLEADEEGEDVFGGQGDVYTDGCVTR